MMERKSKMTIHIFFSDCAGQPDLSFQSFYWNEYVDTSKSIAVALLDQTEMVLSPIILLPVDAQRGV